MQDALALSKLRAVKWAAASSRASYPFADQDLQAAVKPIKAGVPTVLYSNVAHTF